MNEWNVKVWYEDDDKYNMKAYYDMNDEQVCYERWWKSMIWKIRISMLWK